jgi:hypothetical protein
MFVRGACSRKAVAIENFFQVKRRTDGSSVRFWLQFPLPLKQNKASLILLTRVGWYGRKKFSRKKIMKGYP